MKAKQGVLGYLEKVLIAELTAVHQYLLHAALCKNWGYHRLHEHFQHLAQEEVGHSSGLIDHILYLEGTPKVDTVEAIAAGKTVAELLEADLRFEMEDAELLREAITHCTKVGDFTTRHLLEHMVIDTEEHIDWFETQLRTIKQVGAPAYLSEQING
ncbi:bacterioferritin [Nitrospirales bacterium NOB]|nr:MAG: bacterioferritin [Nitrospira sp. OLB3]MBV6468813.1 Bacterioferritin [Nitrospirota bacterium]MCE7964145.1 bacterioferritin [Nitrospira sp. NTP2]MCK6493570.1 bacterioferritin [Nitrospira sp.]MDL1888016.1 bacterioferritin [Nitrospirales bacterium NOB]MEB2337004.1 bacterioferritin [Nitrospirales bacterium]